METRIKRWGNSLALRIPGPLAKEIDLRENAPVQLVLQDGRLIIVPLREPQYSLDALLARVTRENLHSEVETGTAIGDEAW
jgi:antitoxin MazE